MDKTVIEFRFKRPGAFQLRYDDKDGYGNFYPTLKRVLATEEDRVRLNMPAHFIGNVWVDGYDFEETYKLELPTETPRKLPTHIEKSQDATVRTAYHVKSAELAAMQHERNNFYRNRLEYHVGTGLIEIVSDSFLDSFNDEDEDLGQGRK